MGRQVHSMLHAAPHFLAGPTFHLAPGADGCPIGGGS
jgi:hypothetical protein